VITSVSGFFTAIGYFLRTDFGRLKKLFPLVGNKPGDSSTEDSSAVRKHFVVKDRLDPKGGLRVLLRLDPAG